MHPKLHASCVFSSFDGTRCKICDFLCKFVFHESARINKSTKYSDLDFHRDRNIFFNFCLNQRTKVSMLLYKRGWFPQRDFSSRKKKIAVCIYNALYSTQTFVLQTLESRIFEIVRISLRDGVQVFSYITNFVWKDAIRGNDA